MRRLLAAGAGPVATLNMDEFAYGFATINAHYGTTRNPHDRTRLAGGSIRAPAALCGLYGLKPTHGMRPMKGVFPFVESFDEIGPLAATLEDLRLSYEVLRGAKIEAGDVAPLRLARLGSSASSRHARRRRRPLRDTGAGPRSSRPRRAANPRP